MMKFRSLLTVFFPIIVGFNVALSTAQAVVLITYSPGLNISIVQNGVNPQTGKWEIVLQAMNIQHVAFVNIRGMANDNIAYIRIIKDGINSFWLNVGDLNGQPTLGNVDEISLIGGAVQNGMVLSNINTFGNVGTIRVNAIVKGDIHGSVTGDISFLPPDNG